MPNLKCQYTLMVLALFGGAILYVLRVNLSVAIVAMVSHSGKSKDETSFKESCPLAELQKSSSQTKDPNAITNGELHWDEHTQGRILASFFYGYTLTNFIGGRLADKFGGKRVFGGGIFLTALLAFLLPAAARHSEGAFVFIRLLQGMTEGVTFPSISTLMANWIQPARRSLFMSRFAGGTLLGTVLALFFGGWLAQTTFGWPSIFYVSGFVGLLFCVVWFYLVSDHPNSHPSILEEERTFLLQEIGKNKSFGEVKSTPWRSIFTSLPFIATVVAHFGGNFGFYYLLTELPTYLSTVHHFDVKNNGFMSSLPYFLMFVLGILYANQIHRLTTNKTLSIRAARRISTAIGYFVPMVLLLCISYAGCHSWIAVAIICGTIGVSGFVQCGFLCGFQDLAPNYAGTITGISNTVATIPGILAPLITGIIIKDQPTIDQWNKVFVITSLIYLLCGCFYLRYMSAEVQPWNSYGSKKMAGIVRKV